MHRRSVPQFPQLHKRTNDTHSPCLGSNSLQEKNPGCSQVSAPSIALARQTLRRCARLSKAVSEQRSPSEGKAPRLGRCPADCAETGWALSALQTGSERQQDHPAEPTGFCTSGISSSPTNTSLPAPPGCGELRLNISGWPRASNIWGPKTSTTEVVAGPALGIIWPILLWDKGGNLSLKREKD